MPPTSNGTASSWRTSILAESPAIPSPSSGIEQEQWINALEDLWESFARRGTSTLEADLDRLSEVYAKKSDGKRLRQAASSAVTPSIGLPATLAMPVYDGALITPAGRVVLEELREARQRGEIGLSSAALERAGSTVAAMYQRWFTEWAEAQLHGTLSPPVLAFACFLLLSGAIGRENALLLPANEHADRELLDAIAPIIDASSLAMKGEPLKQRDSLRSNWVVSQATRRLGPLGLRRESRGTRGSDADLWIEPNRVESFTRELSERLAARKGADAALTTLERVYNERRPHLLALGAAHDDPLTARRTIERLRASVRRGRT